MLPLARRFIGSFGIGLLTASCTGSIEGGAPSEATPNGASGGTGAVTTPMSDQPLDRGLLTTCDESQAAPPPQRVWMLTPEQMPATVAALYEGHSPGPGIDAITDANRTYDGNDADLLKMNAEQARGLLAGADKIGQFIADNLTQFVTCSAGEASCFASFMAEFAARAWRTPANEDQLTRLRGVYDVGAEVSVADGYRLAVAAVLKSPRFVFRTEIGTSTGAGQFTLTPWEIASALSYLVLDAPPDAELRALAASGAIAMPDVYAQQSARLLADSRARGMASRFMLQLTGARSVHGLAKSPSVVESFDTPVTTSLLQELEVFSEQTFFDGPGTLSTLLTSQQSVGDATVAGFYGLSAPAATTAALATGPNRAGFLTMPVLMSVLSQADHVVPTARGRFVLDKLLCSPIPAPPKFPADAPAANPALSPRERLAVMQDFPACAACHNIADPVGFAFDNFDPVGRYVTEVKGRPVDPSGSITRTQLTDGPFANAVELAQKLAASPEVRACLSWQFLEFSQGRKTTVADACNILDAQQGFEASAGSLRTLVDQAVAFDSLHVRSVSR